MTDLPDDQLPAVLTPREIADRERVDLSTVERWCGEGTLPGAYKIGGQWRVPTAAYLASRKPPEPKVIPPAPTEWRKTHGRKRVPGRHRQEMADRILDRAGI